METCAMCGDSHEARSMATVAGHEFCAACVLSRLQALDRRVAALLNELAAARAELARREVVT